MNNNTGNLRFLCKRLTEGLKVLWSTHRILFFCLFSLSCLIYLPLIADHLVNNYDGLWWENEFKAGYWEVRCGRWLWPVIDNLRFGIIAPPYSSYFAIVVFILGVVIAIDSFSISSLFAKLQIGMLFISTTAVCGCLSFPHQSLTFAFGFLFSVVAAWILVKRTSFPYILFSGLALMLSLGCYQAFFPCTILIFFFIFLLRHTTKGNEKGGRHYVVANIISIICGGVIYKIIWELSLRIFHLSMPSYQGAGDISMVDSLQQLPYTIQRTYHLFFSYFTGRLFHISMVHPYICAAGLFFCLFWVLFRICFRREKHFFIFAMISLLFFVPIVCSCYLLLAVEAEIFLHMTLALAFLLPLFLCYIYAGSQNMHLKNSKWLKFIVSSLSCIAIYGNVCMIAIEQTAMAEGRKSTETIITTVLNHLENTEQLSAQNTYVFLGRPCDNDLFKVSNLWHRANVYHRFGEFGNSASCQSLSYRGVLYQMGIKLKLGTLEEYETIINSDAVKTMPIFPHKGSIMQLDSNIVVIKIAETI